METVHVTFESAVAAARAVVDKMGHDHVMDGACVYVQRDPDECKCIIGHMLIKHFGISPKEILNTGSNTLRVHALFKKMPDRITFDDDALLFMDNLQYGQDMRKSWGTSFEMSLEYIEVVRRRGVIKNLVAAMLSVDE